MFHEPDLEPRTIYAELMRHYSDIFSGPDFGLALIHENIFVNVNPALALFLEFESCQSLLGENPLFFIDELKHHSLMTLKGPDSSPFLINELHWRTKHGQSMPLHSLILDFKTKSTHFYLILVLRDVTLIDTLIQIAKHISLILKNDYHPMMIFKGDSFASEQPFVVNQATRSFFEFDSTSEFTLDGQVHPKDQFRLKTFSNVDNINSSSRIPLNFKGANNTYFETTFQNFPFICSDQAYVLSLISTGFNHYIHDLKAQFNHKIIHNFFNYTKNAMVIVDKNMVIRESNLGFLHQFKFPEDEVLGKSINDFLDQNLLDDKIYSSDVIKHVIFTDFYGYARKMNVYELPIYLEDESIGKYLIFSGISTPIPSDYSHLRKQLFNLSPTQVIIVNSDFEACWASDYLSSVADFQNEEILHKQISDYIAKPSREVLEEVIKRFSKGANDWYGQLWFKTPQGNQKLRNVHISRLNKENSHIAHYVLTIKHIQHDRELSQLMNYFAFHDPFLEMPNYIYGNQLIDDWIYECGAHHKHFSLIKLAFSGLETLGAQTETASTPLLQNVTEALELLLNQSARITRAKDGNLLICHKGIRTKKESIQIVRSILKTLDYIIEKDGYTDLITCNYGLATFPQDGKTTPDLLKAVELSLEKSLQNHDSSSLNEQALIAGPKKEGMIIRYLKQGLHNGEFYIVYQPLMDLKTKKVIGMETLLRWENESVGSMLPKDFIPLAEKSNLIVKIGYFVIGETIRKLNKLRKNGHQLTSSVNISLKQLEAYDFSEKIINIMNDYELPAQCLQFEITESITTSNRTNVIENIQRLTDFGIHFNIDDFGTGYSSLKQIQHLKIKGLKIDASLIHDIDEDPINLSLVKALSSMAQNIGLRLIAEGVETDEELKALEKIGFEEAQGFLFSVPLVDKDIESFIEETNGKSLTK
jgi:EAL domain-containing protein (putative c-di-GMP-specific phosphodiesterase class I)/GGDEF domain-containing protein